jgi:ribosomal-protein-alanine N-acetyltransferase
MKKWELTIMLFLYETEHLVLRILKPDAAGAVLDFYLRDRDYFEQFEPDRLPQFYTINFQRNMLRFEYNAAVRLQSVRFYVSTKAEPDRIIGTVCFHNILKNVYSSCEIGYKFSSAYQHHGYATEALELVLGIIFRELRLHRVMAMVLPDNAPSIRLLERLGFVCEGISREHLLLHGVWADHAQYCLLERDYISSLQSQ